MDADQALEAAIRRSRKNQLTIVLLVATVLVSVVATLDTWNYVQFFPALEQLRLKVSSVQYQPSNSSLNGNVTLTAENPTGYVGLSLQALTVNFTVIANNSTMIPQEVIPYTIMPASLDPRLSINFTLPLGGTGTGPSTVTQILKNGGKIRFIFSIFASLKTFLDSLYFTSIAYQCLGQQVPSGCEQQTILVTSRYGGGGRGGGT